MRIEIYSDSWEKVSVPARITRSWFMFASDFNVSTGLTIFVRSWAKTLSLRASQTRGVDLENNDSLRMFLWLQIVRVSLACQLCSYAQIVKDNRFALHGKIVPRRFTCIVCPEDTFCDWSWNFDEILARRLWRPLLQAFVMWCWIQAVKFFSHPVSLQIGL